MTAEEYIADLLDRAPVATAEQLARVAAVLLPVPETSRELVGAR